MCCMTWWLLVFQWTNQSVWPLCRVELAVPMWLVPTASQSSVFSLQVRLALLPRCPPPPHPPIPICITGLKWSVPISKDCMLGGYIKVPLNITSSAYQRPTLQVRFWSLRLVLVTSVLNMKIAGCLRSGGRINRAAPMTQWHHRQTNQSDTPCGKLWPVHIMTLQNKTCDMPLVKK